MRIRWIARRAAVCAALAAAAIACTSGLTGLSQVSWSKLESASREERMPLDLRPGDSIDVDVGSGGVEVRASSDGAPELRATLTATAGSREQADAALARYRVHAERNGDVVEVRLEGTPYEVGGEGVTIRVVPTVDCVVVVPNGTPARARTSSGEILVRGPVGACDLEASFGTVRAEDATGDVKASSRSGSVEVTGAKGGAVDATSGYGSVSLRKIDASRVRAESRSGSVRLEDVKAGRIEARAGYGRLDAVRVEGELAVRTGSGSIAIEHGVGGPFHAESGYGSIDVRDVAGVLSATTSSGGVRVDAFRGDAELESGYGGIALDGVLARVSVRMRSGPAEVRARDGSAPTDAWSVRSSYGSITLDLPSAFACRIDARTGYGRIDSDFDVAGESPERGRAPKELRGAIGGGGPVVTLETSSGSVRIRKRN